MSRIIIFTGKGGVGKTMISSAHALASASEGKKTLLVSTDMAHNLGDFFEMNVGSEIVHAGDYLDAVELDPDLIMQHDFPDFMNSWQGILNSAGVKPSEQDQFTVVPGLESLFSLMKITQLDEEGNYDRIIVDCAPTGETLSMLKLPELLSWYMEKLFPVGKVAFRILSPITKTFMKVEMPDQDAMNDTQRIYLSLMKVQNLLKDRDKTSIRIVCTPEKMVVEETKRSYMYLNLYHYHVDGIYVNRIIPRLEDNDFFMKWYNIQNNYITELENVFTGIPMMKLRWYPKEVRGLDALREFCRENCQDTNLKDIFSVRNTGETETYTRQGDDYCLSLSIPFIDKDEIEVTGHDMDISVRAGKQNRVIPLPYTLTGSIVKDTEYKDGKLNIILSAGKEGFRI